MDQIMGEGKANILIIDDQPDNIMILEDLLEDHYATHSFNNGASALDYLNGTGHADLILLDVVMPGLDGFEVCRRLKATPATRDIPVIFLTSLDGETDEAHALSLGAEDFIHTPFSFPVVLARINSHLRLAQTSRLLRERNEDMERLTTSTSAIGLWDFDVIQNRLNWSPEMCRLHGITPAEFGGTWSSWLARVHPCDRERAAAAYELYLAEGQEFSAAEFRVVRPDGELRDMKITGIVRRNSTGQAIKMLGNCWDVTEYRRAIILFKSAKESAESANAAKTTFIAKMSHEFRTPLNAIIGFSHLLLDSETNPDSKEYLSIIHDAGSSLLRMVQDLLDFIRTESGEIKVDSVPFDLGKEMAAVIRLFSLEAGQKNLPITLNIAPGTPLALRGDARLFRQILSHLVGNAVKFTVSGKVDITARRHERSEHGTSTTLLFEVADSGPGVRPESQDRIFSMFEQEDNSVTRRHEGAGLGLTISRNLVSLLGGQIWLESTYGVGSRFFFTAAFETAAPQPS